MSLLQQGAQLRHFLAVADEGSVSAAAQQLGISQPALTRSIRRLEGDFGVALFERRPRGMVLTPYGEVLHRHARRIATEIRFAEAEMTAFRQGSSGQLRVGAGPFWGATIVPVAIAQLQRRYRNLSVHLEVGVNALTHPRLMEGELDVVFCALPDAATLPPFIVRREMLANDMRIVAAAAHPVFARTRIAPRDLEPYPWAMYQQDREIVERLGATMQAAGAAPPVIRIESTSMSALVRLLNAGPYLACVSEALINAQPDVGLRIVPVALDIWRFQTGMLAHRSLEQYGPVVALAGFVYDEVAKLKRPAAARAGRR